MEARRVTVATGAPDVKTKSTGIEFTQIAKEFQETFGYVRQDIEAIRKVNLGLNYTVVLLICCACQMLAWHKDLSDYQVFTSLLPDSEPWRSLGKMIFEALRNGLAHRFRPDTLRVGKENWRFSIFWQNGTPVSAARGNPNWLLLSAKSLEERVIQLIDAYEQELRENARTRANFLEKSRKCIREIPPQAREVVNAWNTLVG